MRWGLECGSNWKNPDRSCVSVSDLVVSSRRKNWEVAKRPHSGSYVHLGIREECPPDGRISQPGAWTRLLSIRRSLRRKWRNMKYTHSPPGGTVTQCQGHYQTQGFSLMSECICYNLYMERWLVYVHTFPALRCEIWWFCVVNSQY